MDAQVHLHKSSPGNNGDDNRNASAQCADMLELGLKKGIHRFSWPYQAAPSSEVHREEVVEKSDTERLMYGEPASMEEAMAMIEQLRARVHPVSDGQDCSLESYFRTSILGHLWQRLPWLVSLLLLESISAYSLGRFQSMLDRHMALALFCPMIVGTAGNAGNQPGVIFTRALTMGQFNRENRISDFMKREAILALLTAASMALVSIGRTAADHSGDFLSCVAVSIALFFVILFAIGSGLVFSLLIHRCGGDPAAGAAPLLTSCSDVVGVLTLCFVSMIIFQGAGRQFKMS